MGIPFSFLLCHQEDRIYGGTSRPSHPQQHPHPKKAYLFFSSVPHPNKKVARERDVQGVIGMTRFTWATFSGSLGEEMLTCSVPVSLHSSITAESLQ
jgi:hypothetical protein